MIDRGRQLGEKLINASLSPSAGDGLAACRSAYRRI